MIGREEGHTVLLHLIVIFPTLFLGTFGSEFRSRSRERDYSKRKRSDINEVSRNYS